jgi:hypothetical protein
VPAVQDIVLNAAVVALPSEISLHMAVAPDPQRARILGGFEEHSAVTGQVARVAEITHYPFSFLLVLEGRGVRPRRGADISKWTSIPPDAEAQIRLDAPLAFCNTPIPGDYRTRAQIEKWVQVS